MEIADLQAFGKNLEVSHALPHAMLPILAKNWRTTVEDCDEQRSAIISDWMSAPYV